MSLALFGMAGQWEALIILVVVLILFGGNKLPGLFHSLGKSIGEFKRGRREGERSLQDSEKKAVEESSKEETDDKS